MPVPYDGRRGERYALAAAYAGRMSEREARATPELPEAPHKAPLVGSKETSPELAKLAGRYLNMSDAEWLKRSSLIVGTAIPVLDDVRRLAASVLSQTEPKP